jgi:hypothetical protein
VLVPGELPREWHFIILLVKDQNPTRGKQPLSSVCWGFCEGQCRPSEGLSISFFPGILGIAKARAHGGSFRHESNRQVNRARLFMPSTKTKDKGDVGRTCPKDQYGSTLVRNGLIWESIKRLLHTIYGAWAAVASSPRWLLASIADVGRGVGDR